MISTAHRLRAPTSVCAGEAMCFGFPPIPHWTHLERVDVPGGSPTHIIFIVLFLPARYHDIWYDILRRA